MAAHGDVIRFARRLAWILGGAGSALAFARAVPAQSRNCTTSVDAASGAGQWSSPLDRRITVHANDLSLRDALGRVAAMAKLRLSYSAEMLPLDRAVCVAADGAPVGRVLADLLNGVNVAAVVVGSDQVVLTPRAAAAAPAARHEPEPVRQPEMLDRVVVTGSAIGAPERELTVGLDVVSGRQLARENTSTLSAAMDGFVPGVWTWAQSPNSILTSYASIRGASSFGLSYPKIYVDGIEVANPLLVTRFAPETIDRIEVIRGPQGSALYGTDAISGVVNIVTRHEGVDVDGQHTAVRTTAGVTQSAFAHNVLSQEHAVSFAVGSSTRSANFNITGGSTGDFIPNGYSKDVLANMSARVVGERTMLNTTARLFVEQAGSTTSPLLASLTPPSGGAGPGKTGGSPATPASLATPQSIHEYTVGSTATFLQSEQWTHTIVAGIDGYRLANVETSFTAIPSIADSALRAAQGGADRATLRASSVYQMNGGEPTHATFTFSAEHAALREATQTSEMITSPPPSSGMHGASTQPGTTKLVDVVNWQNNTGLTAQANAAINNQFFFTGGVRVEHDSRLARGEQIATLPMLGVAAVNDFGPFMVKLRAAYGEGVRPPSTVGHSEFWQTRYNAPTQTALGAERQAGTELGFDVLLQHTLSLKVTRFDQRASGLIQQVAIPADSSYESRRMTYTLENVGVITNRGWELEGSTAISRLTLTGTWSAVDSRVQTLARGYTGDLMTGDRMLQVPANTASLNASWLGSRWHASLGASRAFDWINYDEIALGTAYVSGDHPARELLGHQLRQYWRTYTGGTRLRATASRDVRGLFSVELSGDNLLNYQVNEPDNITVVPGRTVMTGVRIKF